MTDIISLNCKKTSNYLSFFNILKYIYLLEMFLVKKYEEFISVFFFKIILVSYNDIKESKKLLFKKKNYFQYSLIAFVEKNSFFMAFDRYDSQFEVFDIEYRSIFKSNLRNYFNFLKEKFN